MQFGTFYDKINLSQCPLFPVQRRDWGFGAPRIKWNSSWVCAERVLSQNCVMKESYTSVKHVVKLELWMALEGFFCLKQPVNCALTCAFVLSVSKKKSRSEETNMQSTSSSRVPTRSGKPGNLSRPFPVRESQGNEHFGQILEKSGGKIMNCLEKSGKIIGQSGRVRENDVGKIFSWMLERYFHGSGRFLTLLYIRTMRKKNLWYGLENGQKGLEKSGKNISEEKWEPCSSCDFHEKMTEKVVSFLWFDWHVIIQNSLFSQWWNWWIEVFNATGLLLVYCSPKQWEGRSLDWIELFCFLSGWRQSCLAPALKLAAPYFFGSVKCWASPESWNLKLSSCALGILMLLSSLYLSLPVKNVVVLFLMQCAFR